MEYLKVAEGNASPKREFRLSKARTQRAMRSNILEAIAQVSSGGVVSGTTDELDGAVRVKIVVKKQDLKQMLEAVRADDKNNARRSSSSSAAAVSPAVPSMCLEQRLNLMRRRHQCSRVNHLKESRRRSSWRPALQSIPEEL